MSVIYELIGRIVVRLAWLRFGRQIKIAGGVFADVPEAVAACVRVRDRIEPDPKWERFYAEGYGRYRALYPALKPLEDE